MKLFYCPKCKLEEYDIDINTLVRTVVNCRDGYGRFIIHYICPECDNVLAGFLNHIKEDDIDYYKSIIDDYNEGGLYFYDALLNKAQGNEQAWRQNK
jgi:transcription elongation factor Elf1